MCLKRTKNMVLCIAASIASVFSCIIISSLNIFKYLNKNIGNIQINKRQKTFPTKCNLFRKNKIKITKMKYYDCSMIPCYKY